MSINIWKHPLEKRNIKKAVMKAISLSKRNSEYVIDRVGYHIATDTKPIEKLDYINEAIDTIKAQNLPVSITIEIFEYVALIIQISRNT